MKNSKRMLTVALGVTLAAIGLASAWASGQGSEPAEAQPARAEETTPVSLDSFPWDTDPMLDQVGLIPLPGIRTCLSGGPPNTCDDYPVAVGGTCFCTSSLLEKKCRECDTREKGRILETTCTICPPCYSPPCQILDCTDRTSRICLN